MLHAIELGITRIARILLEEGICVIYSDKCGRMFLGVANSFEIARLLLDYGADVNTTSHNYSDKFESEHLAPV